MCITLAFAPFCLFLHPRRRGFRDASFMLILTSILAEPDIFLLSQALSTKFLAIRSGTHVQDIAPVGKGTTTFSSPSPPSGGKNIPSLSSSPPFEVKKKPKKKKSKHSSSDDDSSSESSPGVDSSSSEYEVSIKTHKRPETPSTSNKSKKQKT